VTETPIQGPGSVWDPCISHAIDTGAILPQVVQAHWTTAQRIAVIDALGSDIQKLTEQLVASNIGRYEKLAADALHHSPALQEHTPPPPLAATPQPSTEQTTAPATADPGRASTGKPPRQTVPPPGPATISPAAPDIYLDAPRDVSAAHVASQARGAGPDAGSSSDNGRQGDSEDGAAGKALFDIRISMPERLADDVFERRFGWITGVNPFRPEGEEFTTNCVLAAIATDMSLAENLPVKERISPSDDGLSAGGVRSDYYQAPPTEAAPYEHLYRYRDRAPVAVEDYAAVVSHMQQAGPDSRGMLVLGSNDRPLDHVFNVVNDRGLIVFLDGQEGRQAKLPEQPARLEFLPVTNEFPSHLISTDLAPHHHARFLGGSGTESEYTHLLALPTEDPKSLLRAILATGPSGAALTVDEKIVYEGPGGRYYRTLDGAKAAGGPGTARKFGILEAVIGVNKTQPGEVRNDPNLSFSIYQEIETTLNSIRGNPGITPNVPLSKLFGSKWEYTQLGRDTLIGPRPIGDWPGAHVHHNIGVPMAGLHMFLSHVAENTWRDAKKGPYLTKEILTDGLDFANDIAAHYFLWMRYHAGRISFPGGPSGDLVDHIIDQETAELRGYATLLYQLPAAFIYSLVDGSLSKVQAAVLPRQEFASLLDTLPDSVKTYLHNNSEYIMQEFRKYFLRRIPTFEKILKRQWGVRNLPAFLDVEIDDDRALTIRDIVTTGLVVGHEPDFDSRYWGMTILDELDTNDGRLLPMVVLEVRSYGARHVVASQARRDHMALQEAARAAYAAAVSVRQPTSVHVSRLAVRVASAPDSLGPSTSPASRLRLALQAIGHYDRTQGGRQEPLMTWAEYSPLAVAFMSLANGAGFSPATFESVRSILDRIRQRNLVNHSSLRSAFLTADEIYRASIKSQKNQGGATTVNMANTGDAMINGLTDALRLRLTELAAQTLQPDHADETDALWESYSHDAQALRLLDHLSSYLAHSAGHNTETPDLAPLSTIYKQHTTPQTASAASHPPRTPGSRAVPPRSLPTPPTQPQPTDVNGTPTPPQSDQAAPAGRPDQGGMSHPTATQAETLQPSAANSDPARITSIARNSTIPTPQSPPIGRSVVERLGPQQRATLERVILKMQYTSARERLEAATTALAQAQVRLDTNTMTSPCDYAVAEALYNKARTDNDTALANLSEHVTGL
jgi:hypothetical protein